MAKPAERIDLLNQLESLGFDDPAFATLHHFRANGGVCTIESHRRYCNEHSVFQEGRQNARTQHRLKLVLDSYNEGGYQSGKPSVFLALAEAAYAELPPLDD